MFHVTRCPNCRTSFRVTDAHLSAFDGKVRCGRCAFVFDARSHFIGDNAAGSHTAAPTQPAAPNPVPAPTPSIANPAADDALYGLGSMASQLEAAAEVEEESAHHSLASQSLQQLAHALADANADRPPVTEMLELSLDFPPLPEASAQALAAEPPAPQPVAPPAPAVPSQDIEEVIEIGPIGGHDALSSAEFEQWAEQLSQQTETQLAAGLAPTLDLPESREAAVPASESSHHYRPILTAEDEALLRVPKAPSPLRWLWSIPALLALLTLLTQLAVRYRTELAVQLPGMQPRLERLCEQVGCTLELPARAQWLRTEWSELIYVPDNSSLVQLNATLRNQASFAQALPLLELTLSDDSERIVARKVFGPDEYLAPQADGTPATLPDALAAGADLRVFIQLDLGTLKSSGYSLNWFYPQAN